MIVSLLSSLAAITLTNGQINALSTPAPLLSLSPSISPSPSCRPSCPSDAQLVNNMCYWETAPMAVNNICSSGDIYDANMGLCVSMYPATAGVECRPGYRLMSYMNYEACVITYPGKPGMACPGDYISVPSSADATTIKCIYYKNITCGDTYVPEPSQMHPYDPLPTVSPSPSCFLICPTSNQTFIDAVKGTYSLYMQSQYVNGSCYYNMPISEYMGCSSEKQTYIPSSNTCIDYYLMTSDTVCQEGYVVRQMNGGVYCVREVPAVYTMCPPDYKSVLYNDRYICVMKVDAICASPMPAVEIPSSSQTPKVAERTMSPSMTPKQVAAESPSASVTPKVAERTMSSSMTPKQVAAESPSASVTPKVAERTMSPSMTPRQIPVESSSSSQTPKVAERTMSASNTPKVVDTVPVERTMSASNTPKVVDTVPVERTMSASNTPKVVDTVPVERTMSSSSTPKVVDTVPVERTMSASNTPKVVDTVPVERTMSASNTPKVVDTVPVERTMSASNTPKVVDTVPVERTMSASNTPKVVDTVPVERTMSASNTPKVVDTVPVERTMTPRPSNVDVLDYTNKPVVDITATKRPECNIWICPKDYSLTIVNNRTICKYYKLAEYNIIDLPSNVDGTPGGQTKEYFCPAGTKLITPDNYCEGYADAKWIACPTHSPRIRTPLAFPSPIYKTPIARTAGPSRKPLFYQSSLDFTGAIADAIIDPKVIKKLIIGLSCAVNDVPSSITIKSICKKGNETICIPFVIPVVEDALIDCRRMYPSASPSPTTYPQAVVYFRELQTDSSTVQVNYQYQPAVNTAVPTTINVNDSPVLTEVALDISLTDQPSTMVAYGMTYDPATGSNQNTASNAATPDDGAVSRNAIVGIVVGCVALGTVIALAAFGSKAYKRQRKEKLMTSKIEKNPIVDIVPTTDRWAGPPTMV